MKPVDVVIPTVGWACLLFASVVLLSDCRPPDSQSNLPGSLRDTEIFLESSKRWKAEDMAGKSFETREASAERHVQTLERLTFLDRESLEFELAIVYTRLRMLARTNGLIEKESMFERRAIEALRRGGAATATSSLVNALERKLWPSADASGSGP
jgi:hypothetical protein